MSISEQVAALIERTIDAYSFNRYGRKNWELAEIVEQTFAN